MTPIDLDLIPLNEWFPVTGKRFIIAGPCGAESEAQIMQTAKGVAATGKVTLFRAGIWKPRTRPGAFEGKGEEALPWLQAVQRETGLRTTVEVANAHHVEAALKYGVDVLWIGARTTVNPFSVQEIADALKGVDVPVLVKNPVHPDLQLWAGALERVNKAGIKKLAAIHRGFHSGVKTRYRNAPLWELPVDLRASCPELPILCDLSHICGRRDILREVAQQALDLDMDGLMIETHITPDAALSDAQQQITPAQLDDLLKQLVIRDASSGSDQFRDELAALRKVIDGIDEEIVQALARRLSVVEKIGEYKKEHGVTILQIDRWLEILRTRTAAAQALDIDKETIADLCRLLHKASIRRQNDVMGK